MFLSIKIKEKWIDQRSLFFDLMLNIDKNEKIALIGRNGVGKTTLFRMITGEDKEYEGEIIIGKGSCIAYAYQEISSNKSAIEYILDNLPSYTNLKRIIDDYPLSKKEGLKEIEDYTQAISDFSSKGYFTVEEKILSTLEGLNISLDKSFLPLNRLSQGEKKMVELVKVMYSDANIALIDEPTNHMDYVAKDVFRKWLKDYKGAVIIITHDRDVLREVDRIIEIRDKKCHIFNGNYDSYLSQNSFTTISKVKSYELSLRRMDKVHDQMVKARVSKFATKKKGAKIMEERFKREYDVLKENTVKPSIWIDKESIENIDEKLVEKYEKYKDKNIKIGRKTLNEHRKELLKITDLSLGYRFPLFENISFTLHHFDRLMIKGRNGVGKSTLIKAILDNYYAKESNIIIFNGSIKLTDSLKIGIYEQEIDSSIFDYTLKEAIIKIYSDNDIEINYEKVSQIASDYLFDIHLDLDIKVGNLSGGQKARLQIIKMLCKNPNLLILDEPTNHLDLPSIEELEKSLSSFNGAVLYVSHDSYFVERIKGDILKIEK